MPAYVYSAKDIKGKKVQGELTGDSRAHIVTALKQQGLFPLDIIEKKEKDKDREEAKARNIFARKIKKKNISIFTRQFSSMLQAGVPLSVIMDVMIKQERNPSFKDMLVAMNGDILKGLALSEAMSKTGIFPPQSLSMIAVGEANGRLDIAFEGISATMEKELKLASKIKGAMIYPIVLISVSIIVGLLMTFLVLPTFTKIFEQMGVQLPTTTRIFLGVSHFMTGYWYAIGGGIAVITLILANLMKQPHFKRQLHRMILKLPIIGRLQNVIIMARFCRTFSALVDGGVSIVSALETVKNVVSNLHIRETFDEIIQDVQRGSTIALAISKHHVFTPLVISMTRIGEESGRLGEILSKTADIYEEETDTQLQRLTAAAEPMITVIMALGIGFLIISVVQPMFQMYNIMGK